MAEDERERWRRLHDAALLQLQALELLQHEFDRTQKPSPSHRGPTNPRHKTWRGFVLDLQQLEAIAAREGLKLTRANVSRFGTDSWRTIKRTMEWYGLNSKTDWPPSTWDPDEDRQGGAG